MYSPEVQSPVLFFIRDFNMNTNDFLKNYFNVAMKIHAICTDKGLSSDNAKLYVYIYVKAHESPDGIDYFEQDCSIEIDALKSLLQTGLQEAIVFDEPLTPDMLLDLYKSYVNKSMTSVERTLQMECGIENAIHGELANRLRLHIDPTFRKKHLDIFNSVILPQIDSYDNDRIKLSNINYQLRMARQDYEINMLLNN